jgi:ribosome-associated protein
MNNPTTENDSLEVSKSQRKREANELLDLAKNLISMPESRLRGLPLDEALREEVNFARAIKAHGARKRQLMTVGKMLRRRDNEALLDAVNNVDQKNRQVNARFHHVEAWRDHLVEGNNQDLTKLLEQGPDINVQTLRQLIRNAKKETQLGKPPVAARKLFKLLREADARNPLPPLLPG